MKSVLIESNSIVERVELKNQNQNFQSIWINVKQFQPFPTETSEIAVGNVDYKLPFCVWVRTKQNWRDVIELVREVNAEAFNTLITNQSKIITYNQSSRLSLLFERSFYSRRSGGNCGPKLNEFSFIALKMKKIPFDKSAQHGYHPWASVAKFCLDISDRFWLILS